jgi:serine/threonine-protein kinase
MGLMGRTGQQDTPRVGDRYRLVEKLGTGGMSVVWRGYDEVLGRQVAVKVLSPQFAGDDVFRERLRQEALAAARLCHPHITGIFDFGESPLSMNLTVPYVVMELNDGESVSARLRRQGALPWRDAVGIAAEVASALAAAHARGVVHRDITPTNVMLTAAGAKVVDFGISALIGQRDAAPDGSLLGTPAYLAPERLGGSQVRPATDVYALGLLLYQLLANRLPWPAGNTTEALRAHLYADPEPLPPLPGLPSDVAELCLRCLAKTPEDRPSAGEVANRLAVAVGVQPIAAITPRTIGRPARGIARARPVPSRPGVAASALAASVRAVSVLAASAVAFLGLPAPIAGVRRRRTAGRIGGFGRVGGSGRVDVSGRAGVSDRVRTAERIGTSGRISTSARDGAARRLSTGLRLSTAVRIGTALRISAALGIGTALGVGGVRSLGGGVFVGGHLARDVLTGGRAGRAVVARSHRTQAVVATVTLLTVVGLTWTSTRDPVEVSSAQAAAMRAGSTAATPRRAECQARYQVKRDSGSAFEALLTVRNADAHDLLGWHLEFAYPGTQRLTAVPERVVQIGRRVIVSGRTGGRLGPGRSVAVTLRGGYDDANPLPLAFLMDGHPCSSVVIGATTAAP